MSKILFVVPLLAPRAYGDYRTGQDISALKHIRYKPFHGKFPRRIKPKFLFIESVSHYKYKNSKSVNAGGKNVRDGMYYRSYYQTVGHLAPTFDTRTAPVEMMRQTDIGCDIGYKCFCPPKKLPNLRNKLIHFGPQYAGKMGKGACTLYSMELNIHRSRLLAYFVANSGSRDCQVGNWEMIFWSEKEVFWRSRKMTFWQTQTNPKTALAGDILLTKGRPFDFAGIRGYLRPGIEFGDNFVGPEYYILTFFHYILNIPILFANLYQNFGQLPYHFGKATKRKEIKVQQLVCPLELYANVLTPWVFATSCLVCNGAKSHAVPWAFWFPMMHYYHKTQAALTTLYMAINWKNESDATKKMRSAPPLIKTYKSTLIAVTIFICFLDILVVLGVWLAMGWFLPFFDGVGIAVLVMIICLVCGCFFVSQASQIASAVSKASETNEALRAFRKKMIKNLARGGVCDCLALVGQYIGTSLSVKQSGYAFNVSMGYTFRLYVSYFQLVAIEPAAMAKKKERGTAEGSK